jgi:hypothetical protein
MFSPDVGDIFIRRDDDKHNSSYYMKYIGFADHNHHVFANFDYTGEETGRLVFDTSEEMSDIIRQQYRKLTLPETATLLLEESKLLL